VKGMFPPQCNHCNNLSPYEQLQRMIDAKSTSPMENIALTLLLQKVRGSGNL
jgi:hypothetical protein